MKAENKEITDIFGKEHIVVPFLGLVPSEKVVGLVMENAQKVMEQFSEEWPDEDVVLIRDAESRVTAVAEWDFYEDTEYIFVSGVTESGYLSGESLLLLREGELQTGAFSLSIRDFINDIEFKPWDKINDPNKQYTIHDSVKTLAQMISEKVDDERLKTLSPAELINKIPFLSWG